MASDSLEVSPKENARVPDSVRALLNTPALKSAALLLGISFPGTSESAEPPKQGFTAPPEVVQELHPWRTTVIQPSRLERYKQWTSQFKAGQVPQNLPFNQPGHREEWNQAFDRWRSGGDITLNHVQLRMMAETIFQIENFQSLARDIDPSNPGTQLQELGNFGPRVTGESLATGFKREFARLREIDPTLNSSGPDILADILSSKNKGDLSKVARKAFVKFTLKLLLSESQDPLALEKARYTAPNEALAIAFRDYIYDAAVRSCSRNDTPVSSGPERTSCDVAQFVDLIIGGAAQASFCATANEMRSDSVSRLQSEIDEATRSLITERDGEGRARINNEIELKKLMVEVFSAETTAREAGRLTDKSEIDSLYVRLQEKLNAAVGEAIRAQTSSARTREEIELERQTSRAANRAFHDLCDSFVGIGRVTDSKEVTALGRLGGSVVQYLDDLAEMRYLKGIEEKGASALKGLSGSINMVLGVVTFFDTILGGHAELDKEILENVIELRREVSYLNQRMRYDFMLVHRSMAAIFDGVMAQFENLDLRLDRIDTQLATMARQLESATDLMVLGGKRSEELAKALADEISNSDLASAITTNGGEISQEEFSRGLRSLHAAVLVNSRNSLRSGTAVTAADSDVFFESFVREARGVDDPRAIYGYLGDNLRAHFGVTALVEASGEGSEMTFRRAVNPIYYGFYSAHYHKLVFLYPELYAEFCKERGGKDDYLPEILSAGEKYQKSLRGIDQADFLTLIRHYTASSLKIIDYAREPILAEGYRGLAADTNWSALASDDLEVAIAEANRSGATLIEAFNFKDPIPPSLGNRLPNQPDTGVVELQLPDDLLKTLKTQYPFFVLAHQLKLGQLKVSYERVGWTDSQEIPHEVPLFGNAYHYVTGKLYVVLRADFTPHSDNPEGKTLVLFRKLRVSEEVDHIGHKHIHKDMTPGNLHYSIFGDLHHRPSAQALDHCWAEQTRESKLLVEFNMERRTGLIPGDKWAMAPVNGSRMEQCLDHYWPKLSVDFLKNAVDLDAPDARAFRVPDFLPIFPPPGLTPNDPEYGKYYAGRIEEHHENYTHDIRGELALAPGKVAQVRANTQREMQRRVLVLLRNVQDEMKVRAAYSVENPGGSVHGDTFHMDAASGMIHQLVTLAAMRDDENDSKDRLDQPRVKDNVPKFLPAILDGALALSSSAEISQNLSLEISGQFKSLRFGRFTDQQIEERLCELYGRTDFDPNLLIAERAEFTIEYQKSRIEAAALREALRYIGDVLIRKNLAIELGTSAITSSADAQKHRILPEDINGLAELHARLLKNDINDMLFINSRQEHVIRILTAYKVLCIEEAQIPTDPVVKKAIDTLKNL